MKVPRKLVRRHGNDHMRSRARALMARRRRSKTWQAIVIMSERYNGAVRHRQGTLKRHPVTLALSLPGAEVQATSGAGACGAGTKAKIGCHPSRRGPQHLNGAFIPDAGTSKIGLVRAVAVEAGETRTYNRRVPARSGASSVMKPRATATPATYGK